MGERAPTYISIDEIFVNCLSCSNLKSGKVSDDLYVVHLSWEAEEAEGLPFGDQHVWFLYSPTSSKFITNKLDAISDFIKDQTGVISVEFEEITLFTISEIMILSDGEISYNNVTRYLSNGVYGHIGWIVGQGRSFNADDNKVVTLLHSAISNYLMQLKELEDDPFLLEGMKKLLELRAVSRQILKEMK